MSTPLAAAKIVDTRMGLRNSTTRIPFRYGKACLTACPQIVVQVNIAQGKQAGASQAGYSADCLPPGWFDKTPGKTFAQQIDDMFTIFAQAEAAFRQEFSQPCEFFTGWLAAYEQVHCFAKDNQCTPLLASFGVSLFERALIDALLRANNLSFAAAMQSNALGLAPEAVHASLAGFSPQDWLPAQPQRSLYVRHTVGLGDPLTASDVSPSENTDAPWPSDGFPVALEDYISRCGLKYFKIKTCNNLDVDLARLHTIADLIERYRGDDYFVTLDGNEQYSTAEDFDGLIDAICGSAALATFWRRTLVIEQPLDRRIALDEQHTAGIRRLAASKPVIIDESDGELGSYARAIELGYRGVSSKNCKGPIKSILNAGLTWLNNEHGAAANYVMTGEDLCTVGVVAVQSDLCLIAALGLTHIERNGHHYHRGLSYLPEGEQRAALAAHGDFYACEHGVAGPHLTDGKFNIGSLQCTGFGFDVTPDFSTMQSPDQWEYASLGLE